MKTLIKNGMLITASGRKAADVEVGDGKILGVFERGENICEDNTSGETIDAAGLLVLPGAIDPHVHFSLPYSFPKTGARGFSADDHFTGTRSAACGGVTTVIDFVTPEPGETLPEALARHRSVADSLVCIDYSAHMSLVSAVDDILAQMKDIMDAGINSFKVFMTYAFRLADDALAAVLGRAKKLGAVTMVHAEAHEELEALKAEFISQRTTDPWHHYLSRPEAVEANAVRRVIELARQTGVPGSSAALYIVHLACSGGLEAVKKAQSEGYEIYAETCPQYLHFTNDVFKRPDGHNFVCSPPMKGEESRRALLQGIKGGLDCSAGGNHPADNNMASGIITGGGISVVATDHCPFMRSDKAAGADDFTVLPNGVGSVEVHYPYMLSLACGGDITYERAVELCCENPAKIFKLDKSKGRIAPGMDADIVLFDPAGEHIVSQADSHSAADYTIWEGTRLKGAIRSVYSRGSLVFQDGIFYGKQGAGRFLERL